MTPYSALYGHLSLVHLCDPSQLEYRIGPYFFHCVTLLFLHFLPSVARAARLSLVLEMFLMLYTTKPSIPSGNWDTSCTGALSHISGSYFRCLFFVRGISSSLSGSLEKSLCVKVKVKVINLKAFIQKMII